jgi:hypothetical protein
VSKLRRVFPTAILMMVAALAWFAPASAAKNVGQLRELASRSGVAMAPEPDPDDPSAPTPEPDPEPPANNPGPAEPEAPTNNPGPAEPEVPANNPGPADPDTPTDNPGPADPDTPTDNPGPADPDTPTDNPGPADPEGTVDEPQPGSDNVEETPGATEENEPMAPVEDAPLEISPEVQAAADEAVADIFDEQVTVADLGDAVTDLVEAADTPEEVAALVGSLLEQDLSDEQFAAVADNVFADNMTDENFVAALDAVFTEPLSDEQFDSALDSVLDEPLSEGQFDDFVSVLDADTISEEQVSSAVDAILENDISETEAESLAQSETVLESIDGDQAVEIFDAIELDGLTDEEGAEIVDAVQNADNDVRGAFEDELNIFEGQFDTYVPLNSKINVEDRRTVVAVSVVSTAAVATMGVRGAMPMGGGAPVSGGSAELAEAFKSESNRIRRISKYKHKNGKRVVDKKNFSRKLVLSIMQNSFTLVGFIVVYLTLSGSVRTIAGIATLIAFFSTLYIDMREGDED